MLFASVFLLGALARPPLVVADPHVPPGRCASLFERAIVRAVDGVVDASAVIGGALPTRVATPLLKVVSRALDELHEDWRAEFNARVIARHFDEAETFGFMPDASVRRDMSWQATRALASHRPDLERDPATGVILVHDRPLLLFAGREDTPLEIPAHVLLVVRAHVPMGWFADAGNRNFSVWTPLGP